MITGLERRGDLGAREAHADREPAAESFRQTDDVGIDVPVLGSEPASRTAQTGLNLIEDEQHSGAVA